MNRELPDGFRVPFDDHTIYTEEDAERAAEDHYKPRAELGFPELAKIAILVQSLGTAIRRSQNPLYEFAVWEERAFEIALEIEQIRNPFAYPFRTKNRWYTYSPRELHWEEVSTWNTLDELAILLGWQHQLTAESIGAALQELYTKEIDPYDFSKCDQTKLGLILNSLQECGEMLLEAVKNKQGESTATLEPPSSKKSTKRESELKKSAAKKKPKQSEPIPRYVPPPCKKCGVRMRTHRSPPSHRVIKCLNSQCSEFKRLIPIFDKQMTYSERHEI